MHKTWINYSRMRRMIMSNPKEMEELLERHNSDFWKSVGSKTHCRDEETCETLNEFLDTAPKMEFSYIMSFAENQVGLTIDLTKMAPMDQVRLNLRLMNFLKEELQLVKNSM